MSKPILYRQCILTRPGETEGSQIQTTCWLPERKGAKEIRVGTQITLADDEDGILWEVESISALQRTEEQVRFMRERMRGFGHSLKGSERIS